MQKILIYILVIQVAFLCSCTKQDFSNLQEYLESKEADFSDVIACSASDVDSGTKESVVSTFFYPRDGATNFKLYETTSVEVDETVFSNYSLTSAPIEAVFGGKLRKFTSAKETEKFMIVTFEENDSIRVSDPIHTRILKLPTSWEKEVLIDHSTSLVPKFSWQEVSGAVIYFQVVSDDSNEFLSGTYTYDLHFTYNDYSNVVLDINTGPFPQLVVDNSYHFTLMSVTDDNWVVSVGEEEFVAE